MGSSTTGTTVVNKILITGGAGYIGSVLAEHLRCAGHYVNTLDNARSATYETTYQKFSPVAHDDTIIHLAAHSSVAACEANPAGALGNNLIDLMEFVRRLRPEQTFIFASTGSLYDSNAHRLYDGTKRAAEMAIPLLHPKSYILRFGTVCGVSPTMREDLILNGMVRDAVRKGVITVYNPGAWRPVLFFADLCYTIERLLGGYAEYGTHGIASFQTKIGGWADMVAHQTAATIVDAGIAPHYNFRMDVLPRSLTTPEAVIEELVEYWRDHS